MNLCSQYAHFSPTLRFVCRSWRLSHKFFKCVKSPSWIIKMLHGFLLLSLHQTEIIISCNILIRLPPSLTRPALALWFGSSLTLNFHKPLLSICGKIFFKPQGIEWWWKNSSSSTSRPIGRHLSAVKMSTSSTNEISPLLRSWKLFNPH